MRDTPKPPLQRASARGNFTMWPEQDGRPRLPTLQYPGTFTGVASNGRDRDVGGRRQPTAARQGATVQSFTLRPRAQAQTLAGSAPMASANAMKSR